MDDSRPLKKRFFDCPPSFTIAPPEEEEPIDVPEEQETEGNMQPSLPPCQYKSLPHHLLTCANVGCCLAKFGEEDYCCPGHKVLSAQLSSLARAYQCFGGLVNVQETCVASVLNKAKGLDVGIPLLADANIFLKPPWDQPHLFNTDDIKQQSCAWLFFTLPPTFYPTMEYMGLGLKWKGHTRFLMKMNGVDGDVFMTEFSFLNSDKSWKMHLFQCSEHSLYCISKEGLQVKFSKVKSNKKDSKAKPDIAPKDSSSSSRGSKSNLAVKFQTTAPKSSFMRPPGAILAPGETTIATVFKFVEPPENNEKPMDQRSRDECLKVKGQVDYVPEVSNEEKDDVSEEQLLLDPNRPNPVVTKDHEFSG